MISTREAGRTGQRKKDDCGSFLDILTGNTVFEKALMEMMKYPGKIQEPNLPLVDMD